MPIENDFALSREQLPQVWQNANWSKMIEVFGLEPKQRGKSDEVWIKPPFSGDHKASLHLP